MKKLTFVQATKALKAISHLFVLWTILGASTPIFAQQGLLNTISGTVQRANGSPVEGITVQLTGDTTATTQTNAAGAYSFPDIAGGSNVQITPSFGSDDCRSDCIDLMDYVLILGHVVNNPALASPYDEIAGDVNNDGRVTIFDYVNLFNFKANDIPFSNLCWRFIPADFELSSLDNYPETIQINGIETDVTANFIGVQIGDVNGCQNNIGDNFLQVNVASRNVSCTEVPATISVPITANNFSNIRGLSFGIEWDASQITYTGVSNLNLTNLSLNNFSTGNTSTGNLGFSWPSQTSTNLPDGSTLFELQFNVINNSGTNISIGNTPFQQQVIDGNFSSSMPIIQNGAVIMIGCDSMGTDSTGMVCDNGALDFDGIDDFVQITSPIIGNPDFTFETWVKTTETDSDFRRFLGLGGNNTRFEVGSDDGRLKFFYFPNNEEEVGSFIADGQWHHIAIVKSGNTVEIFKDGSSDFSVNDATVFDFTSSLRLGRWTGGGTTGVWRGQMDEVRLWDSAKPIGDIIATQNCHLEGNEQGLLFYFDFNQGLGNGNNTTETALIDLSSNQNNGELRNFALTGAESNWVCADLTIADDCVCEPAFTYELTDSCGTVQFMNQSTGTNLSFLWNFGDGNTSNLENPTHTYTTDGNYQVTLTVFNNDNCDHSTQQNVSIVIDNTNPVIACLNGLSINLGNDGTVTINPNDFIQDVIDNCGLDRVFATPNTLNCSHLGAADIIITAVDLNGNMAACTTSVQVTDGSTVCQPQLSDPFKFYGLEHLPFANTTTGKTKPFLLDLGFPNNGAEGGLDIQLDEAKGHAINYILPNPSGLVEGAYLTTSYWGTVNGQADSEILSPKLIVETINGTKYYRMSHSDIPESSRSTVTVIAPDGTELYKGEAWADRLYWLTSPNGDMDFDMETNNTKNESRSNDDHIFLPQDDGEAITLPKDAIIQVTPASPLNVDYFAKADIRGKDIPSPSIGAQQLLLFSDEVANQALGETAYVGAHLTSFQAGNLLSVSNLKDVSKDGVQISKTDSDGALVSEIGVDWMLLEFNEEQDFELNMANIGTLNGGPVLPLSTLLMRRKPTKDGYLLASNFRALKIDQIKVDILIGDEIQGTVIVPDTIPFGTNIVHDTIPWQVTIVPDTIPFGTNIVPDTIPFGTNIVPDTIPFSYKVEIGPNGEIIPAITYSGGATFQIGETIIKGNQIRFSHDQDPGEMVFQSLNVTAEGLAQMVINQETVAFSPPINETTFSLPAITATCGDEVCVDVTVTDFQNIVSGNFFLNFDPSALQYLTVSNTAFPLQIDDAGSGNGTLGFNFVASDLVNGNSLADGTSLATICFDVSASTAQSAALVIPTQTSPSPTEFFNVEENEVNLLTQNGNVNIEECTESEAIFNCGDLIVTCEPGGSGQYSVGLYNLKNITNAPLNTDWGTTAPTIAAYHGPNGSWNQTNLGHVFGIAIDDINGNFYVTATNIYGPSSSSNPNKGGVYRINGNDGSIDHLVNLPNQIAPVSGISGNRAPELGNICFDRDNQQLFVTNFEDGKIYRLDLHGNILPSPHDPLGIDDGTPGFSPLGERLWGIAYYNQAIYYSVWAEDKLRTTGPPNSIRKVDLVGGDFNTASDQKLFDVPDLILVNNTAPLQENYSNPVSDIVFSQDGKKMLLAQRSMHGDIKPTNAPAPDWAHKSKILEYENQSGTWIAQNPEKYVVGSSVLADGNPSNSANSSGGIDFGFSSYDITTMETQGCDEKVWGTGDALHTNFGGLGPDLDYIYGLIGLPATGGDKTNSILIDLDGDLTKYGPVYKTDMGDVEIWQCGDCETETLNKCDSIQIASTFIINETDTCCHTLSLDNQVTDCFSFVNLVPQNGVQISSVGAQNGWSLQGFNTGSFALLQPPNNFIPVGTGQDFVDICLTQYTTSQQQVVVEYWGPAPNFEVVCTDTLNFNCPPPPPDPKCIKIIEDTVTCLLNGDFQLDFDIMTNPLIGFSVTSFSLNAPTGITFTPKDFVLSTPLAPGGMTSNGTFTTTISGGNPSDLLKFSLTAHDVDITNPDPNNPENCCTDSTNLACIQLPEICDPCIDISANLTIISPISGVDTNCCFTIDLTNNFDPNLFTSIETEILTGGVHFGAICNIPPLSGWSMQHTTPYSNTNVKWTPFTSNFVGTNTTIPKLCLNGIDTITQVPQEIEIRWMIGDSIACRDTVRSECPPPVHYACAQLRDTSIICNDNGTYTFQFSVQNNSSINTTDIELTSVSPTGSINPVQFPVPISANGGISPPQTAILTGTPGSQICFIINLHEINNNGHGNCCADSLICITLPPCNMDCVPEIICQQDTCINLMEGETGIIVNYPPPIDLNDCETDIVCNPPSGSFFECGTTVVVCTITDIATGNETFCEFDVIVKCGPDPPMPDTCEFVNNGPLDCLNNEVNTKTFSTIIIPDQTQLNFQYLEATLQNHQNEYVGLGILSRGNNEHDLYFVKTDDKGTVLPDAKKLVFSGTGNLSFSLSGTVEGNTHFFKQIIDAGNPSGYVAAVSFEEGGLKGGLITRINEDGCVVWSKKLDQSPTEDIYIRGIVQNNSGAIVCLVQRNSLTATSIIEMDLNGAICQRMDYQDIGGNSFLQPTAFTLVNGLPNAAAEYALCGTHFGAGAKNIGVYLLDANYQPFNNTLFIYDIGNTTVSTNLTPSAIIQDGTDLVMSGYRTSSGELVGFMQKITPFNASGTPDGTSKWFYEYEIGNTVAGNSEHDVLYDLVKTPDNKLVTTGFHADNLANQTRAILFQVDENGIPEWAYQYNESNYTFSNSQSVFLANDNGFVLSGSKFNNDPLSPPSQFWMAKTDANGILRDCDCVDTTCVIANLIIPDLNIEQWEGITEMCNNTDLQNTCSILPAIQEFCDQFCPVDPICEIEFICPQDFTVACCSMVELPIIEVIDSCDLDTIICTREDGLALDEAFPNGTTCVICDLLDEQNVVLDTCRYYVTVVDEPPTIICPNDTLINLTAPCEYIMPDVSGWITVEDGCEKAPNLVIGTGYHSNLVYFPNGDCYVWGSNNQVQLGLNPNTLFYPNSTISTLLSNQNIISLSGSNGLSAAVKADGTLLTWGDNLLGRTGQGTSSGFTLVPTPITGTNWEKVYCGVNAAYAIKKDDSLWGWGNGVGSTNGTNIPIQLMPGTTWKEIASGLGSIGLRTDGTIWFLGVNPTQFGTDNDWVQISAEINALNYYAIKQDGTLWSWSNNNSFTNLQQIGTDTDWACVQAAREHIHAVKTDGTLWGWGSTLLLGNGVTNNQFYNSPQQIGTDTDWTCQISADIDHTLAVKEDGSVYTWGDNSLGQIGNGNNNNFLQNPPHQVFSPNSGGGTGTITIIQDPPVGTVLPPGMHDITIIAEDDCGNQDTCMFKLTLDCDMLPPQNPCDSVFTRVEKDNTQMDSCCYNLFVDNQGSFHFPGIRIGAPAPTEITSVTPLISGWTVDYNTTLGSPIILPPGSPINGIPMGNLGPVARICTDKFIDQPHEVCVEWLAQGREGFELLCKDTVLFDCDTMMTPPISMDTCCMNEEDFLERAANININPVYDECSISVNATLDTCDLIWYDWGDGSPLEGPYIHNTPVTHNYNPTGPYTVCYIVAEEGPSGDTCWSFTQCLPQVVDCPMLPPECTCGNFRSLQLHNGDGSIVELDCAEQVTYDLKCPTEARSIYFDYICPEGECPYTKVASYKITNQTTNEMMTGTVNLNVVPNGPLFPLPIIPLPEEFFENPGLYTVAITTYCGDKECVCELEFVSGCKNECTCDDLFDDWYTNTPNDWDQGSFGFPDINDWISGCQLNLQPRNMENCDKISWRLTDLSDNTVESQGTGGNNLASFSLTSGHTYELMVNLTRFADDGSSCSLNYTSTRTFYCGGPQGLPCGNDLVTNPSFVDNLEGWQTISGNPEFIEEGGSDGNGYVLLGGSNTGQDAIGQNLSFNPLPNTYYKLSFDVNPISVLPGTRIVVSSYETLPDGTICEENCEDIGQIIFDGQGDEDWPPQDPMFTKYMFNSIVFHIENDYPNGGMLELDAKVGIDNICIEMVEDDFTCPDNLLENGGFSKGAIPGPLSQNNQLEGWKIAAGQPHIRTGENAIVDWVFLELSADADQQDGIYQQVPLGKGTYELGMDLINTGDIAIPVGAKLVVEGSLIPPSECEDDTGCGIVLLEIVLTEVMPLDELLTIIRDTIVLDTACYPAIYLVFEGEEPLRIGIDNVCLLPVATIPQNCCLNDSLFLDQVGQGFNFQKLGCNLEVSPKALDPCIQVTWNWGDGTTTGPLGAQQSATHTYSLTGNVTICMIAQVIENDSICFQEQYCQDLSFDCEPSIDCCLGFSDFSFTDGTTALGQGNCGDQVTFLRCDLNEDLFEMTGNFACAEGCLSSPISYTLINFSTNNSTNGQVVSSNGVFQIPLGTHGPFNSGNYSVTLNGICGSDSCSTCTIDFSIKACSDECCIDFTDFESLVNQGFSTSTSCESLTVTPKGLNDCDLVNWRWGDGTSTSSVGGSRAITHLYTIDGATEMDFEVCMEVFRFDNQGNRCLETVNCGQVTIENCCSCEDFSSSFEVNFNCNVVTFEPIRVYNDCDVVRWKWGDNSEIEETVGRASATHQFAAVDGYVVQMTVSRSIGGVSCGRTISRNVSIGCLSTSLENIIMHNQLRVFPNPTNDQLFITLEQPLKKHASIRLMNIWGQVIYNYYADSPLNRHEISMNAFAAGIYLLEIQEEEYIYREKIIKQ